MKVSKIPEFDVFSLLEFRKRTARSHGIKKNGNFKRKCHIQRLANCTLRDLAAKLDVHGRHCMLSYLSSLPISVLPIYHYLFQFITYFSFGYWG